MAASWQYEKGYLACQWCVNGPDAPYNAGWMQENPEAKGSYLAPLPDFASHSPFGGVSWFQPNPADRE